MYAFSRLAMTLCLGLLLALGAGAQAPPPPDNPPPHQDGPGDGPLRGRLREQAGQELLDLLKAQDPAAYQRLEALRGKDPEGFKQALREELRKRGIPALLRDGPAQRGFGAKALDRMKTDDPAEYERIMKLRQTNPEGYRQALRGLFERKVRDFYRQQDAALVQEKEKQIHALVDQYRKAAEADRAELEKQLRATLSEAFDAMTQGQEQHLEQLRQELQELQKKLEERKQVRDQIIDLRMKNLLSPKPPREGGPRDRNSGPQSPDSNGKPRSHEPPPGDAPPPQGGI